MSTQPPIERPGPVMDPDANQRGPTPGEAGAIIGPKGHRMTQLVGLEPELVQDIRDQLRTLPHKDVDLLLRRLSQCPVINVELVPNG